MPRAQRCIIGSSNKKQVEKEFTQLPPFPKASSTTDCLTHLCSSISSKALVAPLILIVTPDPMPVENIRNFSKL